MAVVTRKEAKPNTIIKPWLTKSSVQKVFVKIISTISLHLGIFISELLSPIHDGPFRGCSRMGWGPKSPPPLKSATNALQWWNLAQLYLTQRRSRKRMNHVTHPLSSTDINIFSLKISKFCYDKKYRYRLHSNA